MQQLVYICFSSLTCSLFSLHPSPSHIYTSLFTHHCVPSLIPPFENHLIRKACEAHMSSPPLPPPPHTPPVIPLFFFATKLSSPFSAASSSYFLISCLSVLYLTNYAERLEAVAWPGKQRRSCKDINIHPGINIRSESQVGQTGGDGVFSAGHQRKDVWMRRRPRRHTQRHDTILIKGDKFEIRHKLLSFRRLGRGQTLISSGSTLQRRSWEDEP